MQHISSNQLAQPMFLQVPQADAQSQLCSNQSVYDPSQRMITDLDVDMESVVNGG